MQNDKQIKEEAMTNPGLTRIIAPEELLEHWQGHRSLTRRVIEVFNR